MSPIEDRLRTGRKLLTQVFRYLEALNHHRNPAKRHLDDQLWRLWFRDVPDHPSIRIASFSDSAGTDNRGEDDGESKAADDFVIRVRRPKLTPCPSPPEALTLWLERGWQEPSNDIRIRPSRNESDEEGRTVIVRFEDDPVRLAMLERWRT